ncbi:CRISPR-associated protein Cas2 [Myxococcus sp. 1LA]
MAVMMISYDLSKPGQNYEGLYAAIKSYRNWAHPVESVWLIETPNNAAQVRDHLAQYMDANDTLVVLMASREWATKGVSTDVVTWLQGRM